MENFTEKENKDYALDELKINFRQIMFLTSNKKLIERFNLFLSQHSEITAMQLIECFRKDLWK